MKKKTRNIIIVAALLLIAACVAYVLIRRANRTSTTNYQTEAVTKGTLTAVVGATGSVRANQTAILAWQTTGRIEAINVKVGDEVTVNQVLATLARDSLSPSIISAQADLITAQKNLDELKTSSAQAAQAQLNLANAQKNLEDAKNIS